MALSLRGRERLRSEGLFPDHRSLHPPMRHFRTFLVTAVLAPLTALPAQRPASWVPLALGAPLSPGNIGQLGKTCAYIEGNKISFFSAFARNWKSTTAIAANVANLRVFNDLAFLVDQGQIIAFSSYRGEIEVLPVSGAATVVNPIAQRNDSILTVVDGTTLWTFTCFEGKWKSRTLTSPTPRIVTQRHVLMVGDGTSFHGMSAFDGNWVTTTAPVASTGGSADGSWGVLETPTTLYGFSAQRATWTTAPALPAGYQVTRREDTVIYWDSSTALAFTGLRGAFTATALVAGSTVDADALVGVARAGGALQLYSAVLGTWTPATTAANAAVTVKPHQITWNDASGLVGSFSPFLGSVALLPVAASVVGNNDGVAAAVDALSSRLYLFSTLTGAWVTAPRDSVVAIPAFLWCGALVKSATGYYAYAGRTGRFVPLAASAAAVAWTDSNSSVMAVEDGNTLSVFEPRREVWLSVQKVNAGPLVVRIWRTTLLAVDGSTVHGFGTFEGTLESYTLPAVPTEINANSESVRAGVGTTLALFGGTPDLVTLYQFPEFRRAFVAGSNLEIQVHGAPGAPAWAAFGFLAPAPVSIPTLGELFLDANTLAIVPLGTLPADGRVRQSFFVPDVPALRRLEACFQGIVAPTSGTPYLTRLATVLVQ